MVLAVLAILFVVMPLLELYVIIQVGQSIGALNTIGLLVLVSLVGAWLARHEGVGVLQRIRQQLDAGRMPTDHLIDGALVLTGGLLLLLPGFISDAVGLLVLFPPTRALIRGALRRRFTIVTVRRYNGPFDDGRYDDGPGDPPVIDV
jgi:UPF0716 protein FxsA